MDALTPKILIWCAVTFGYAISRTAELRIHRRNYPRLLAAGAEEVSPRLSRLYYLVQVLLIPAALIELLSLKANVGRTMMLGGLVAILVGHGLRLWVINSLGSLWTMRTLAFPGLRWRPQGPYRWLPNPDYCSRIIDGVGVCLVFGAKLTLLAFLLLTLLFNRRMAKLENVVLEAADERQPSTPPVLG